jgi:3-oxoadipate enol-lactonase
MPFIETQNLKTHYALTGDAKPVLAFSNSLGTNFSMWDPQLPALQPHFRILRYDTRGHGQSSVTAGDYTIEQLGRDFLALLDALSLDRVNFCGLSMGGVIGIWLAINAPTRLDRVVLANTAARIGTKEIWEARISSARRGEMKSIAAAVVERWFTPEFRASSPDQVAQAQKMLENSPPEGYAACCAAIRDMDLREPVSQIKAPTLVIYGAKDPVIPAADAQFLADKILGSKSAELNASHLSNVEQAEAFTETIRSFLLK